MKQYESCIQNNNNNNNNAFFQPDWVRACWGRWAGPRLLSGRTGGCWIFWAEMDPLHVDLLLVLRTVFHCTKQGGRGVGEGVARGRSDA